MCSWRYYKEALNWRLAKVVFMHKKAKKKGNSALREESAAPAILYTMIDRLWYIHGMALMKGTEYGRILT